MDRTTASRVDEDSILSSSARSCAVESYLVRGCLERQRLRIASSPLGASRTASFSRVGSSRKIADNVSVALSRSKGAWQVSISYNTDPNEN